MDGNGRTKDNKVDILPLLLLNNHTETSNLLYYIMKLEDYF